jgi:hypothetical protein
MAPGEGREPGARESRLFAEAMAIVRLVFGAQDPLASITIRTASGRRIYLSAPLGASAPAAPVSPPARKRTHSSDYRSVSWDGDTHHFTPLQAAIVRQLWQAMENGTPGIGGETLFEAAGSADEQRRMDHVFRNHPAWRTMIISPNKGIYALAV